MRKETWEFERIDYKKKKEELKEKCRQNDKYKEVNEIVLEKEILDEKYGKGTIEEPLVYGRANVDSDEREALLQQPGHCEEPDIIIDEIDLDSRLMEAKMLWSEMEKEKSKDNDNVRYEGKVYDKDNKTIDYAWMLSLIHI